MKNKLMRFYDIIEALENYVKMSINEETAETRTEVVTTILRIIENVPEAEEQTLKQIKELWRHELKTNTRLTADLEKTMRELENECAAYNRLYDIVKDAGIEFNFDGEGNINSAYLPLRKRLFFRNRQRERE